MKMVRPSELKALMKAKYVRRTGTPGHYQYYYKEGTAVGQAREPGSDPGRWKGKRVQFTDPKASRAAKRDAVLADVERIRGQQREMWGPNERDWDSSALKKLRANEAYLRRRR